MILRSGLRFAAYIILTLVLATDAGASHEDDHGFDWFASFQGSANAVGVVNRLDTSIGYRFNRFVGLDLGIPFYFVKPSDSTTETNEASSASGVGNVYADLRLTLAHSTFRFTSVLTGTAPTGDKAKGLSTGRGTADWTNTFSNDFRWAVPFLSVGLANTISDTSFFVRPFTSVGLVGHIEAGSYLRLNRFSSVGASGYKVIPSGEQTIVSRLVRRETAAASSDETAATPSVPGRSMGRGRGGTSTQPFEVVFETAGEADLARDHGGSVWLSIYPASEVDFYVGFSRSVPFDLNTFFYGVSFNLGSMIRRAGH